MFCVSCLSQICSLGYFTNSLSFFKNASCLIGFDRVDSWPLLHPVLYSYTLLLSSHVIRLSPNPWSHPRLCSLLSPSVFSPKPSERPISSGFTICCHSPVTPCAATSSVWAPNTLTWMVVTFSELTHLLVLAHLPSATKWAARVIGFEHKSDHVFSAQDFMVPFLSQWLPQIHSSPALQLLDFISYYPSQKQLSIGRLPLNPLLRYTETWSHCFLC